MEIHALGPLSRQGEFRATGITPWGNRDVYCVATGGWIEGAQWNSGLVHPELENGPSAECGTRSFPAPSPLQMDVWLRRPTLPASRMSAS